MRPLIAACALVASTSCATMLVHGPDAPSSPDEWKLYVKRWAKPTERAVLAHTQQTWPCNEVAVKPVGYGALSDDDGKRTPYLEWSAMGCSKDAHYLVTCPSPTRAIEASPGKVACDVNKKRVVAPGMPSFAPDASTVVVDDERAASDMHAGDAKR